uniref:DOMON domain-containing protein n=1 Tax=Vombatus ursinus TaxID=29139 RepID=A0A4X2MAD5_VOMUR
MCRWSLLFLWGLLPGSSPGATGRSYPHRALLDWEGKYWLHWGHEGNTVAFRLEVQTPGYVGLGFSTTGAMTSADIVLGGVENGSPYLQVSTPLPVPRIRDANCALCWRISRLLSFSTLLTTHGI